MNAGFAGQLEFFRAPILETIGIACASVVAALVIGVPLALGIAREGALGAALSSLAAFVRAIPELVLAVVAVVAVGLGPAAGIAALGVAYAAVIGKVYADLLRSVRAEPSEALRATGASETAAFLVGVVPLAWNALVGFAVYAFESIVRASVIVGVVGAGGLGAYIIQSLNLGSYREFGAYVAALVVVVTVVDAGGARLRRAPPWAAAAAFALAAVAGFAALGATNDPPWSRLAHAPPHLAAFVAGSLPPQITWPILAAAGGGVAQTLFVAVIGTLGGALLAVPLAAAIARPLVRGWMRGTGYPPALRAAAALVRVAVTAARSAPPVALALVAVIVVGLGPKAGALALVVHTAAVLAKLLGETLDAADTHAAEALVAGGATGLAASVTALVPENLGAIVTHVLYRFEWNVRASTILGAVGAGGLGQAIFTSQQLLFYRQLSTYVIVAVALVLISDRATAAVRRRLELRTLASSARSAAA